MTVAEINRFWDKVAVGKDRECWPWLASYNAYGYGQFRSGGTVSTSHRKAWECFEGPIPCGMTVDHKCRNTACQNPAHMELVSRSENTARGNTHRNRRP